MSKEPQKVRVEFSLTINLGDFNSARLGCALEDYIEEGDTFDSKFNSLYGAIRTKVRKELALLSNKVSQVQNEER